MNGPQRIVCLTEETTELLYALGEQDRIVGISAFTERPARAKQEKPIVSAFTGGSVRRIRALEPDLVVGFSDVQAELAAQLIHANLPVLVTNQRSVSEILETMQLMGRIVDASDEVELLIADWERRCSARQKTIAGLPRPRVYFEEWDDPQLSAILWVSELIELAGGVNIFADRAAGKASRERTVQPEEVLERKPDLIIGCWCGKPLDEPALRAREQYGTLPAVQANQIVEMDPAIILQPGLAALTDGFDTLCQVIDEARVSL